MVDLETLGFKDLDSYINYFFKTLLPTNRTYNYYVDWDKVLNRVYELRYEFSLLNYLIHVDYKDRRSELKTLIKKYPSVVEAIPYLLAIRERSIDILELVEHEIKYKRISFNKYYLTDEIIDGIIDFTDKVGLLKAFDNMKDVFTFVYGVEVGLDSNARKNRSGEIFQEMVAYILNKGIEEANIKSLYLKEEDPRIKIGRNKRADFVIYYRNMPKIVIEVNFYTVGGSKPTEIINSYLDLSNRLRRKGIIFVWVTDGKGWLKMKRGLNLAFKELDFLVNYTILKERIRNLLEYIIR